MNNFLIDEGQAAGPQSIMWASIFGAALVKLRAEL